MNCDVFCMYTCVNYLISSFVCEIALSKVYYLITSKMELDRKPFFVLILWENWSKLLFYVPQWHVKPQLRLLTFNKIIVVFYVKLMTQMNQVSYSKTQQMKKMSKKNAFIMFHLLNRRQRRRMLMNSLIWRTRTGN